MCRGWATLAQGEGRGDAPQGGGANRYKGRTTTELTPPHPNTTAATAAASPPHTSPLHPLQYPPPPPTPPAHARTITINNPPLQQTSSSNANKRTRRNARLFETKRKLQQLKAAIEKKKVCTIPIGTIAIYLDAKLAAITYPFSYSYFIQQPPFL